VLWLLVIVPNKTKVKITVVAENTKCCPHFGFKLSWKTPGKTIKRLNKKAAL
jgi:hypothetical protein